MKINKIVTRNIGPFGNKDIEIDFTGEPLLWLLMGKNGRGKSSLIKIIKMGLYHEYDVPIKEVANDINGEGYICIWFNSKGQDWVMESGYKPNYIRLYSGTEPIEANFLDKGKLPETKEFIKNQVLDYPYYIFNNVISLNIDDFKSFLKMNAKDARNIRDRIFGFYVINEMVELHKNSVKAELDKYESIQNKMDIAKQHYTDTELELSNLKNKIAEGNQEEIDGLKKEQDKIIIDMVFHTKEIETLDDQIIDFDKQDSLFDLIDAKNTIEELKSVIQLADDEIEAMGGEMSSQEERLKGYEKKRELIKYMELLESVNKKKEQTKEIRAKVMKTKADYDIKFKAFKAFKEEVEEAATVAEDRASADKTIGFIEEAARVRALIVINDKLLEESNTKISGLQEVLGKLNDATAGDKAVVADYKRRIEIFEKGECDQCGSDLTVGENSGKLAEMKEMLAEVENKFNKNKELYVQTQLSEKAVREVLDKAKSENSTLGYKLSTSTAGISLVGVDTSEELLVVLKKKLADLPEPKDMEDVKVKMGVVKEEANTLKSTGESSTGEFRAIKSVLDEEVVQMGLLVEKIGKDKIGEDIDTTATKLNEFISSTSSKIREYQSKISESKSESERANLNIQSKNSLISTLKAKGVEDGMELKYMSKHEIDLQKTETLEKKQEVEGTLSTINSRKHDLEYKIRSLSNDDNIKAQLDGFNNMLAKIQDQIDEHITESNKLSRDAEYNKLVLEILSDTGIKSYILADIVPYINHEISDNLQLLDVPLDVLFDDEFQAHIYRRGKEVSLGSISTGQKKKINFSILMAITLVLINRYGNINIIFYDEIFSSVDEESRIVVLNKVRKYLVDDLGIHVILVNHFYFPSNYFDKYALVQTEGDFSEIEFKEPDAMIDYVNEGFDVPMELEKTEV